MFEVLPSESVRYESVRQPCATVPAFCKVSRCQDPQGLAEPTPWTKLGQHERQQLRENSQLMINRESGSSFSNLKALVFVMSSAQPDGCCKISDSCLA